jgi:hypothetical protein
MTREERQQLHIRLDALGVAITTKLQHLQEGGRLDIDASYAAAFFHLRHILLALQLDASTLKGHPAKPKCVHAKEIALLTHAFNLWVIRNDRKYARWQKTPAAPSSLPANDILPNLGAYDDATPCANKMQSMGKR